jgi:hypothetical protein
MIRNRDSFLPKICQKQLSYLIQREIEVKIKAISKTTPLHHHCGSNKESRSNESDSDSATTSSLLFVGLTEGRHRRLDG